MPNNNQQHCMTFKINEDGSHNAAEIADFVKADSWDVNGDKLTLFNLVLVGKAQFSAMNGEDIIISGLNCVFKDAYRPNGSLNFGDALTALKKGQKVARSCWNDLQYVVAQGESKQIESNYIWNPHNKAHAEKLGGYIDVAPYCTLKTVQDTLAMGWTPSTGDLFANDWLILE